MNFSEHISAQHLSLKALIYIRQSTQYQVMNNQESRQLQHALKQRAIEFGWPPENIEIIDADLGITGANIEQRQGFQYLLTQIALGAVGIVFSYDVTRLSRNCSDWYPLLDICGYKKTLIGDREGIYDPRTPNGRLILGLKGQFAEIELNTIRARMNEGLLNKAKRGELIKQLPTGFVNQEGVVLKDPNLEVQNCIQCIFDTFIKLKSAAKTLKFFRDNDLNIPRYVNRELKWKKPTVAAILSILKNPAYAGAYVYGRTQTSIVDFNSKKKQQKKLSMNQWKYVIKDKFPKYITWEIFENIQNILKDNHAEYNRNQTRGIPRSGKALLHGILYCGVCGHKMCVQYKNYTQYLCNHLRQQYGTRVCQFIIADPVDNYVVEIFFQALSPIELNAYEKIVANQWHQVSTVNKMKEQQLERLRYQVKLAERQYNQVDPDNRLVALELERRWELALKELKESEIENNDKINEHKNILVKLPNELKEAFCNIGEKLPRIWNDLLHDKKKAFLRCLIEKVVIHRKEPYCIEVRIVWQGGATTTKEVLIPVKCLKDLPFAKEFEKKVLELATAGHKDNEIAEILSKEGYHSTKRQHVLPSTVKAIRLKHGIMQKKSQSHPLRVNGFLTAPQMARKINMPTHWIYDRIRNGKIKASKNFRGCYLFPDTEETLKIFVELKNQNF
jgi:DNA invertase Pin-like site-specific DNA recombinase